MYKSGQWNAICDVCGFEFKSSEMRKRWDGLMVCDADFEHDHPQKYLRVREDTISVPWVRSEPEDDFVNVCYIYERSAYADLASADCATADNTTYPYLFLYQLKNAGTT
jgi:hypothetical protein